MDAETIAAIERRDWGAVVAKLEQLRAVGAIALIERRDWGALVAELELCKESRLV